MERFDILFCIKWYVCGIRWILIYIFYFKEEDMEEGRGVGVGGVEGKGGRERR